MATSKTLTPTNVTIQIPAMTDAPDQSVNSNCIDKLGDAVNTLNSQLANKVKFEDWSQFSTSSVKVYTLQRQHIYLLSVSGNEAWGDSSTVALIAPGSNGQMLTFLNQGRHPVTLSGNELTITRSDYGGGYISLIMIC